MDDDDGSSLSEGNESMLMHDDANVARMGNVEINIDHAQDETTMESSEDDQKAQELRLLLQQQQQEYQKAQEEIAAEHHQKYLKQQQQAGHTIPVQHTLPPTLSNPNNTL